MFAGVAVGLAVGASVDVSMGDDGFAVDAAVGIAAWTLPWLSPLAFTVFRYLPRHFEEARGMSAVVRGTP